MAGAGSQLGMILQNVAGNGGMAPRRAPEIDHQILQAVQELTAVGVPVFPRAVQLRLAFSRSERQLRRDFNRLADQGFLYRVHERRGWLPVSSPLDEMILGTVVDLSREMAAVWPWTVQAWMPLSRSERQLRRDFNRLAGQGYLERVGCRRGWRPSEYLM